MKIAIVTSFPKSPNAPRGGVESVCVNLLRGLAGYNDLELHVVTTDADRRAVSTTAWDDVMIHRLPRPGRRVLSDAIGPGRRLVTKYLLGLAPDVVHAHDVYGLMVRGLSLPRVLTIHGFIHADTRLAGGRLAWLRSQMWRWIETAGWAEQPHIVSISPYVRERLSGIAGGVIHDIDNPVAEAFFDIPRRERKGTIFCAATISHLKNTLGLIEAFARLTADGRAASLRLAGTAGDENYELRVRQRINALGLGNRVTLLGQIDAARVREELGSASVFALPSFQENSPMGIEEAMAAGVPVVASNRCGIPYLVRDGETGFLVDPNDTDDICERLTQLLEDDALRAAMGERSRRVAEDRFHPAAVARRTRQVYIQARGVCSTTVGQVSNCGAGSQ